MKVKFMEVLNPRYGDVIISDLDIYIYGYHPLAGDMLVSLEGGRSYRLDGRSVSQFLEMNGEEYQRIIDNRNLVISQEEE